MMDQAQALRDLIRQQGSGGREAEAGMEPRLTGKGKTAKLITVTSGKGGVGKSNFTLNFALALQAMGRKVLVFDADIGMANIDVLMGISPKFNLYHLLQREKSASEIIEKGPHSLSFIAGGSGLSELLSLSEQDLAYFTEQIEGLADEMDYIIFDTGAGLSKENLNFIRSADECLVVTTPEPTSITDAYALIKVVSGAEPGVTFKLIINRAGDEKEAAQTADKIAMAARRFLGVETTMLGYIADDSHVVQAVKKQVPFSLAYPNCNAAKDLQRIAYRYLLVPAPPEPSALTGIKGFMHKWLRRTK
ncbi:MinD/ParA family protein [Paenibacillus favisporus]|uniref:Flagellar biosynthesis protein FlhG n=1 Tax=Paenibacillus favisporus TaxID=221028 RepID=A0ABV2F2X5_9BACL|nr:MULTISPECIES: MinD/ParA family protein [Paenibacillus]MEC0173283.1 MinD/ParA family protein [Paenibacillus favisporus]